MPRMPKCRRLPTSLGKKKSGKNSHKLAVGKATAKTTRTSRGDSSMLSWQKLAKTTRVVRKTLRGVVIVILQLGVEQEASESESELGQEEAARQQGW